jgi:hypothetical protein
LNLTPFTLWLLASALPVVALAQTVDDDLHIVDVRFIGHQQVVDTLPLSEGRAATLGDDGLIIVWDAELRPLSWLSVPAAERLAAPGPDGFVAASSSSLVSIEVADDGALQASPPIAADAVVYCADHSVWWWPRGSQSVTWLHQGVEHSFGVQTEAASEAACITAGDRAAIFWPDAGSVRLVTTDAGEVEIPSSLFRLALRPTASPTDFVLTGIDENRQVQGVRVSDGTPYPVDSAPVPVNICGAYSDSSLTEHCPGDNPILRRRATLPATMSPVDSILYDDAILLWGPDGAVEVRHDAAINTPPWGIDFVYMVARDNQAVVACGHDLAGPAIISFSAADASLEQLVPVDECPDTWWFLDTDPVPLRLERLGALAAVENSVSTPPLGRGEIQFAASPSWEPGCGGPAWRITRRDSDLIESPGEAICARQLTFHPVYSSAGALSHVAARATNRSGQVEFRVYNFVGDLLATTAWSSGPVAESVYPRLVFDDGVVFVAGVDQGRTLAWKDGAWQSDALPQTSASTALAIAPDGRVEVGDGLVFLGGSQGWVAFTENSIVAPLEILPQLLVGWSDGTWTRGDDRLVAPMLGVPFLPVDNPTP